jgi:hypothetical protein
MEIDSSGKPIYFEDLCPYCQLDSGGGHAFDCPNNHNRYVVVIGEKLR